MSDFHGTKLTGGYRLPFDPRPLLNRLASGEELEATWRQLWDELHHQGDVGEASYAAVPRLVRIYRESGAIDWNTYAIVSVIELARGAGGNPQLPEWLEADYMQALHDLAEIGARGILKAQDSQICRAILSLLALEKGLRTQAKVLISYSDDGLLKMVSDL